MLPADSAADVDCLVALGANLGDRRATLEQAVALLPQIPGVSLVAKSSWISTAPIGGPAGQGEFLNGAVRLAAAVAPSTLLAALQTIESRLGRQRRELWEPRLIDLDLLLYGEHTIQTPAIEVPHPRMAYRRFVLAPAAEIADDMLHPSTGLTLGELARRLDQTPNFLAITGPPAVGKTTLARQVADHFGGRLVADSSDFPAVDAVLRGARLDDPSGSALDSQLRFLHRQSSTLAAGGCHGDQRWLAVSDFWPAEALVAGRAALAGDALRRFDAAWRSARQSIVSARLIVVLDAPSDVLWRRLQNRGESSDLRWTPEAIDRIRGQFDAWAGELGNGPVLRLATEDADERRREVFAAVEAMQ